MSAVPGPVAHTTLYTVLAEKRGERRVERFRDPVDAERRKESLRQQGYDAGVVPPQPVPQGEHT